MAQYDLLGFSWWLGREFAATGRVSPPERVVARPGWDRDHSNEIVTPEEQWLRNVDCDS